MRARPSSAGCRSSDSHRYVPAVALSLTAVLASAVPGRAEAASGPFSRLFVADPIAAPAALQDQVPAPSQPDELADAAPVILPAWTAQDARPAPPPEGRTGFKALLFETASDFKAFPMRRSTWVILGIGAGAAALAHPADDNVNDHLMASDTAGKIFAPGKYIGAVYVQAGIATGLYVIGRYVLPHAEGEPRTNKVSHLGFDLLRAVIVSQALTQGIKYIGQRDRPTGECCAFPSGHASAAFATASVLERHLGYRGAWPTFLVAAYVATSRLQDNRHFLSDVIFGSALGIASGWTVVGRHGRSNYALTPMPVRGGMMVSVTRRAPQYAARLSHPGGIQ